MKKSQILEKLLELYRKKEELDSNLSKLNADKKIVDMLIDKFENQEPTVEDEHLAEAYTNVIREAPVVTQPVEPTVTVSNANDIKVAEAQKAAIKQFSTESSNYIVEKGGKVYDVHEEWIGQRPVLNGQKVDIETGL